MHLMIGSRVSATRTILQYFVYPQYQQSYCVPSIQIMFAMVHTVTKWRCNIHKVEICYMRLVLSPTCAAMLCTLGSVKYSASPDSRLYFWNSYRLARSSSQTKIKCSYIHPDNKMSNRCAYFIQRITKCAERQWVHMILRKTISGPQV